MTAPSIADPRSLNLGTQGHLVEGLDKLTEEERTSLLQELAECDFEYIDRVFQASMDTSSRSTEAQAEPIQGFLNLNDGSAEERQQWSLHGLHLIAQGKVAILLLAGGQGTRLGSTAPKGCYDIGLPSHKSLFQLQAERLVKLQQLAAAAHPQEALKPVKWLIMTSPFTYQETLDHFKGHSFFGLLESQVIFFQQGSLPCLTEEGKVIMESKCTLSKAPDGNGGVYRALDSSGVLNMLASEGVEAVDCYCVDNALAKLGDPLFIGYCHSKNAEVGARVVSKASPDEKVGVFAVRAGAPCVLEYSELAAEQANARNPSTGDLLFNCGNICMHYFSTEWLVQVKEHLARGTAYHVARKKIPSKDGPIQGIKLELFIFDTFPTAKSYALMEVDRAAEFAPVKNAPGSPSDSPDTARLAVLTLGASWLKAAGGGVEGESGGEGQLADTRSCAGIEISPLVSYAGEGLEELVRGSV